MRRLGCRVYAQLTANSRKAQRIWTRCQARILYMNQMIQISLARCTLYFSRFQRWKLHLLHHVGGAVLNCRRSSRPGHRVARRSACSSIDGADRTPHCIRALGNSRHTLAEVHMSLQNTEKVQKYSSHLYEHVCAPELQRVQRLQESQQVLTCRWRVKMLPQVPWASTANGPWTTKTTRQVKRNLLANFILLLTIVWY